MRTSEGLGTGVYVCMCATNEPWRNSDVSARIQGHLNVALHQTPQTVLIFLLLTWFVVNIEEAGKDETRTGLLVLVMAEECGHHRTRECDTLQNAVHKAAVALRGHVSIFMSVQVRAPGGGSVCA